MRNEIAEWMLSKVAPPMPARTVVGDLVEAQLEPVGFWRSVFQAAASIAGRDPRRFLVSLTGFAIQFGVWAVFAWAFTVSMNPRRPFLAVYGVTVLLFLLCQWIMRFIMQRVLLFMRRRRQQKNAPPVNDRPVEG